MNAWVFLMVPLPFKGQAKKRSPQRKRKPQMWVVLFSPYTFSAVKSEPTSTLFLTSLSLRMLSLRRLRATPPPQRWPLRRSQRWRMLQGRVDRSPNPAKLKEPLKHQKRELRNQLLRKEERKLQQRQKRANLERKSLQKPRGNGEKSDAYRLFTVFTHCVVTFIQALVYQIKLFTYVQEMSLS